MESLGRSQSQKLKGPEAPRVFWQRDLSGDFIHHDNPKAFPHNVIILSSRTNKMGSLSLGIPLDNV